METVPQSRRSFITTLALLLASGALLVRYLTPRLPAQRQLLVSAADADVPVNGALVFPAERLALLRDEKGFYALSLICTHLGCTVKVTADTLTCPCHGSMFDRQGRVLKGPADRSLGRLQVTVRNGVVEVMEG
ncbi:MAG: Rieske (2Fe-2S) protein [Geobacteraceae bacterium]|nr:Rieske (2Fe-2S) protein [Geobacteraceae bacterium]